MDQSAEPLHLLTRTNTTFPICYGNDVGMCIWERIFSKVVKLSTFRDFRVDLLSVAFHKGQEPFTYLQEMVRPQITWKFQNICSDDDYYVNPAQSLAEESFSMQVRRWKGNLYAALQGTKADTEIEVYF